MAIVDNALCTFEDVQLFNDGLESIGADDTLIEEIINYKTQEFHKFCAVDQFLTKSYTERYNGTGTFDLWLYQPKVTAITSIHIDSDWTFGSDTLVDSTNYMIVDEIYVASNNTIFTEGNLNIKVVYTAGYTAVPDDIRLACIKEVSREFNRRNDFDVTGKTLDDGSVQYTEKGILKSTKDVLNRYRNNGSVYI